MVIIFQRIRRHDYDQFTAIKKLSMGEWDGVVLTSAAPVNYFNKISNSPQRIDYTRDRIMPTILIFPFKKHSLMTTMFDEKIKMFNEAGLINRWLNENSYEKKCPKYKRAKSLTIINISAILKITTFMYLISGFVFVLEVLCKRCQWIRKLLDFFTY